MTAPLAPNGLPWVVVQALDDTSLPHAARLMMWHLRLRLDVVHWVPVKGVSLASEMRVKERTALEMLSVLSDRGYLDVRTLQGRARGFRFPASKLPHDRIAA